MKDTSTYKDVGEFGVNYTGEFSGFGVSVGATLTTADGTTGGGVKDFAAWNLGAQITYGALAFGGGYVDAGDFLVPVSGAIDNDRPHGMSAAASPSVPSPSRSPSSMPRDIRAPTAATAPSTGPTALAPPTPWRRA